MDDAILVLVMNIHDLVLLIFLVEIPYIVIFSHFHESKENNKDHIYLYALYIFIKNHICVELLLIKQKTQRPFLDLVDFTTSRVFT